MQLQRLHIPADRLHGLLFEHPGEQGHQLLLAFPGELVLLGRLRGKFLRGLLLGRRALDLQPGVLRRERSLLIGKVHPHLPGRFLLRFRSRRLGGRLDPHTFGARRNLLPGNFLRGKLLDRRFGGGLLRIGGRFGFGGGRFDGPGRSFRNPGRRFGGGFFRHDGLHGHFRGCLRNLRSGFFRSGGLLRGRLGGGHFGFRDSGSHGRIRLRIFSRRADLLLGSRKCRFFSSHFSTRFWFPHVREHINLANITILCGTPKRFRQNMQQRRPPEARNRGIPARRRGFPVCPGPWSRVCSPLKPHSSPSDQRLRPFAAMRLGAA